MQAVEEALQDEGLVLTRETDFAVVQDYLRAQLHGVLHIVVEDLEGDVETDVECIYGLTPLGEYIIRWYSESIEDVLTNGKTHLFVKGHAIYFNSVREAFFGDTKAFVICTPSKTEVPSGNSA